jgi:hypothetical protein
MPRGSAAGASRNRGGPEGNVMIVLYLAVAVVMLTLATQLLLSNVTSDKRGFELIRIPTDPSGDHTSDR